MHFWIFASEANGFDGRVRKTIEALVSCERIRSFNSLENMEHGFRHCSELPGLVVLCTATREEVEQSLALSEWLSGLPVILVLPDRDEETISLGHRLRPRLLTFADSAPSEVGSVVEKLCGRQYRH